MSDSDHPGQSSGSTSAATGDEPSSVASVVEALQGAADGKTTRMHETVEALGEASFVPVLMAPALAVVTPLSGVPLFSSLCGLLIALVAGQMLLNRNHLWLPGWLMRRQLSSDRVRNAVRHMKGPAAWLDRHTRERLTVFVRRPFKWITQAACLVCGAAMPMLELVPFTSSILGAAVVFFSLSLLVRDGLWALFGFAVMAGAGVTLFQVTT